MITCKLCRSQRVETFFERDRYPLSVFSADRQPEVTYAAIKSGICPDCGYIMLVAPRPEEVQDIIYDGFYVSSNPVAEDPNIVTDARVIQLLDFMSPVLQDDPGKVLEIGSYDGQVLYQLRNRGWEVYGCEPNSIGQQAAQKYQMEIKQSYFQDGLYPREHFDLVIARFVLEHVPDPMEFLRAIWGSLRLGGHVVVDVPDDESNTKDRVIGTFVPEHVSYFGSHTLKASLTRAGFDEVELLSYRGGVAAKARRSEVASSTSNMDESELADLIESARTYRSDMTRKMTQLQTIIRQLRSAHKRIAVYGANTITLDCLLDGGLEADQIDYVVDDDVYKKGHFLVEGDLEVFTPQRLSQDPPDAIMVCAYFSQEIVASKIQERLGPEVRIIRCYPSPNLS